MGLARADGILRRILVADDDESARGFFERLLRISGYDVVSAPDGRKARELLKKQSFDAIVSDISMPGMGGIDLLTEVRQYDLDVPVILVTGDPCVETAVPAVQYGALRYLTKPVPAEQLLESVSFAIRVHDLARTKREALAALGARGQELSDLAGLETTFRRSLGTLWMAYQAIVSRSGRRIHAYEALVRSDDASLSTPKALLEVAERLGRIHELGQHIRQRVAAALPEVKPGVLVFVNLHPKELEDESLYASQGALSRFADRIVLEVTERACLEEIPDLAARAAHLRKMGYRFALDDLGAGYSGLSSLVQLNPEVVKIDMGLVRGVHTDPTKRRLISSIRDFCKELGSALVAEGVESAAEQAALDALGIDLLQGYNLARPEKGFVSVPPSVFE